MIRRRDTAISRLVLFGKIKLAINFTRPFDMKKLKRMIARYDPIEITLLRFKPMDHKARREVKKYLKKNGWKKWDSNPSIWLSPNHEPIRPEGARRWRITLNDK